MVAVLHLVSPAPYEANAGWISGPVPRGIDRVVLLVDGRIRRIVRTDPRNVRLAIGPLGLPAGDHAIEVRATRHGHTVAKAVAAPVFGLPASAAHGLGPRRTDRGVRRLMRSLAGGAGAGVATGAWALDLATGEAASWNAGATMPAASTLKLAVLATLLAREGGDPVRSSAWPAVLRMVRDSSNRTANALIDRVGGSWVVNGLMADLGATGTDLYGHYLLEPGEPKATPPADVTWQPSYPAGKHTSAHDLGLLATALVQASTGRGRLAALGVSRREARVAAWLLLHATYPGLVRPAVSAPVGHKAGWLPRMQHDVAIVYRPRGPVVIALLAYREAGVDYGQALRWSTPVVRRAIRGLELRGG